jgi:hypothetical protein
MAPSRLLAASLLLFQASVMSCRSGAELKPLLWRRPPRGGPVLRRLEERIPALDRMAHLSPYCRRSWG